MRVIDTSKPVTIELSEKSRSAASKGSIVVAAEDHIYLDITGVEFEHRASGKRRFLPWWEIKEMWQSLD